MTDVEFRRCAKAQHDLEPIYEATLEAYRSYEFRDLDEPRITKAKLLAQQARMSSNNDELLACNQMQPRVEHILEYCPQSQYTSAWCTGYVNVPEVIAAKAEMEKYKVEAARQKAEEDEAFDSFQKCARLASDYEAQEKQYDFQAGLYRSGYSSITHSQIESARRDLNNLGKKWKSRCDGRSWRLPAARVTGLCSHPAYTSRWCSDLM